MSLHAFATITPKPIHFQDAKAAIISIVDRTREEAGCLTFDLLENQDQGTLHLYENWTGRPALDAHYAEEYTKAVFAQYEGWLAEPVAITFMQAVDIG